jgi:hypothetical protein
MSTEDYLTRHQHLTLDDLTVREWVLFERHVHPPLYELILDLAKKRNVHPTKIHHFVAAEEALLLKTFVASRADNGSKLASELLRVFIRKLGQFTEVKQLVLPMGA